MARPRPGVPRLIIMVKEPRLGAVKTRLGREIGAVAATRFYRSPPPISSAGLRLTRAGGRFSPWRRMQRSPRAAGRRASSASARGGAISASAWRGCWAGTEAARRCWLAPIFQACARRTSRRPSPCCGCARPCSDRRKMAGSGLIGVNARMRRTGFSRGAVVRAACARRHAEQPFPARRRIRRDFVRCRRFRLLSPRAGSGCAPHCAVVTRRKVRLIRPPPPADPTCAE